MLSAASRFGLRSMLTTTTRRRLAQNARALTLSTGAAAAAGFAAQSAFPSTARAEFDPRVAIGTVAGLVAATTGGPAGIATMAAAAALVTINPGLSGSGSRAVVIAGPSGVGKGTLIGMLQKDMPDKFGFSVSHATRTPRPGEVDGEDYHFVTVEVRFHSHKLLCSHI